MKLTTNCDMLPSPLWTASLPVSGRSRAGLPARSSAAIKEKTWRGNYGTGTEKEAALLTQYAASILMIGSQAAGLCARVRQAGGGERDKARDSTADARRRRTQQ